MSELYPVYVVTATYNEADNLPTLVHRLFELRLPLHLIVVDDASPDGTGELAEQLAARYPGKVTVVHRPGKLGYASAHRRALSMALNHGAATVITMDADLSHDPGRIPALMQALEHCDVVVGSRYVPGGRIEGWGWFRHFLSRVGGRFVTRLLTGLRAGDCTSGFRAYRAPLLRKVRFDQTQSEGYGFLVEMLFRCQRAGARICEVPIVFVDRRAGRSKLSKRIILESALLCFKLLGQRLCTRPHRGKR